MGFFFSQLSGDTTLDLVFNLRWWHGGLDPSLAAEDGNSRRGRDGNSFLDPKPGHPRAQNLLVPLPETPALGGH